MKTFLCLLIAATLAAATALGQQTPPPATPATNAAPTDIVAATNAPAPVPAAPATSDARRQALEQALTNRLFRAGVGRGATNTATTNAAPAGAPTAANAPATSSAATNAPGTARPLPAAPATTTIRPPTLTPPTLRPPPTVVMPSPATTAAAPAQAQGYELKFRNAALDLIFEKYAELSGRTVLHPANLQGSITVMTQGKLSREEALQALDGALALNNITMIPQGEKFIKAVPSAQAVQEGAAMKRFGPDEFPDAEQFVTHVVQLKTVRPSELAQMLSSFTKNPNAIVPIDSSQMIVLRDYASNVRRMLELIKQVDVTPESDYRLEVIPIKYGKVTDLYATMNSVVAGATGGTGFLPGGGTLQQQQQRRPGQLPTVSGRQAGAGQYGNTLRNAPGQGQFGQQQAGQFGQQQQLQGQTGSFQQRLNQIVNRAAGESQVQVLGDARIVPDERSNSLVVFANKQDMQMITNIVSKIDVLLAQVMIEGIVLAVRLDNELDTAVSWLQQPKDFNDNISGAGLINNGNQFLNLLTNFPAGQGSGFTYLTRFNDNLSVSIRALASDNKARILQRPRIQTSHAVPGSFFTGQTVPYVTGVYNYGGIGAVGTQSQVEQLSVGSTIQVTPYITPDGLVVMDIYQDISQIEGFTKIDNNDVPTTSSRNAQATLSVRDGETIVFGGYIQESKAASNSGVPVLKDIPLLGFFFSAKGKKDERTELIMLLKVTVLKTPTDAALQAKQDRANLPGVSDAFREFGIDDNFNQIPANPNPPPVQPNQPNKVQKPLNP